MVLRFSNNKLRLRNGVAALVIAGLVHTTGPNKITLTAQPVNQQIYQRVGTSKLVPVSCTFTGNVTQVQARAVPVGTALSSTAFAWADIPTNTSTGTASGILSVNQGCWYVWQVRDKVDNSITATGANSFGVGMLIALIGQSNMEHLFHNQTQYPLTDLRTRQIYNNYIPDPNNPNLRIYEKDANGNYVYRWDMAGTTDLSGTWKAGSVYGTYGGYDNPQSGLGGDSSTWMLNTIAATLNIPVGAFFYAVGGSNIESWQPGVAGNNYANFVGALAYAGGDCEAAFWLQGEQNSGANANLTDWQSRLSAIVTDLKTRTNRPGMQLSFAVMPLGPTGPGGYNTFGPMRAAQMAFIKQHASDGVFLGGVTTDMAVPTGDNVHMSVVSLDHLAYRYAKSLLAHLSGTDRPGPSIDKATYTGSTVTVNIVGGVGALNDGVGGTGANLKGFRIFSNGTQATITSTAIVGNTVVLTVSVALSGTVTIDYAMEDLPYGSNTITLNSGPSTGTFYSPPSGAVLYDSDVVPGDTLAMPLQPCAAITVAPN